MSHLLELLGSRYPIIQGPIGHINSPKLVAAICEAGSFGMLALGFVRDPQEAKRLAREVRELTDKPFGANLMIMNPAHERILEIMAEMGVKTITTSAGSPRSIYPKIHALGMKGLHVALTLPQAIKAEDAGADGVVASGLESGGLRSPNPESSTMVISTGSQTTPVWSTMRSSGRRKALAASAALISSAKAGRMCPGTVIKAVCTPTASSSAE